MPPTPINGATAVFQIVDAVAAPAVGASMTAIVAAAKSGALTHALIAGLTVPVHSSTECKSRSPGHHDDATFKNMIVGSPSGCFWIQD